MIEKNTINDFIRSFNERVIGDKTVGEIINYKGHPIWWFVGIGFTYDTLPNLFDNRNTILTKIKNRKKPASKRKTKKLLRKLRWNERLKNLYLKFTGWRFVISEESVIFISPTTFLKNKNEDYILDKFNDIQNALSANGIKTDIISTDPLSKKFSFKIEDYPNVTNTFKKTKKIKKAAKELAINYKKVKKQLQLSAQDKIIFNMMEAAFDFYFSKEIIGIILTHYEYYRQIMSKYKTKLFVIEEASDIRTRALIAAGKDSNTPVLHIYHGLGNETDKLAYSPNLVKSIPGRYACGPLSEMGFKKEQIYLTGPTFMDEINKVQSQDGDYILFLTQTMVEDGFVSEKNYINKMTEAITSMKDNKIVIKMHPREIGRKRYIKILKKLKVKDYKVIGNEGNLYDLISKCKMVVAYGSTAIIEAIAIGKPVILLDIFSYYKGNPLFDNLKTIEITQQKEFVEKNLHVLDGAAKERNVRLIKRLIDWKY